MNLLFRLGVVGAQWAFESIGHEPIVSAGGSRVCGAQVQGTNRLFMTCQTTAKRLQCMHHQRHAMHAAGMQRPMFMRTLHRGLRFAKAHSGWSSSLSSSLLLTLASSSSVLEKSPQQLHLQSVPRCMSVPAASALAGAGRGRAGVCKQAKTHLPA